MLFRYEFLMKKSKEIIQLQNDLFTNIESMDIQLNQYFKKINKETKQIIIDEKNKLIEKIASGEGLDVNLLKNKYLKSKELNTTNEYKNNLNQETDELLDKIIINNNIYYYENKEKGNVFDINNNIVGYYKNSNINFI